MKIEQGTEKAMTVHSPSFTDNGIIPKKHTGFGADISPELIIENLPEETVSLAIVLDDLDVPLQKSFTHWLIWNIPKTDTVPEGIPHGTEIRHPFPACQGNAWGKHRYRGPKQPFFIRKEHRYVFTVYALDCRLSLSPKANKKALLAAMDGHISAKTELTGRYKRSQE